MIAKACLFLHGGRSATSTTANPATHCFRRARSSVPGTIKLVAKSPGRHGQTPAQDLIRRTAGHELTPDHLDPHLRSLSEGG